MFAEHQPMIAKFAMQSETHFVRTAMFARLTVRRHLWEVPKFLDNDLYPSEVDAICAQALQQNGAYLYLCARKAEARKLFYEMALMPGFGFVKAGFVTQLVRGQYGCLDTHNQTLYKISRKDTRKDGGQKSFFSRADNYLALCAEIGSSEALWNTWCDYVAALYPHRYENGNAVSHMHVTTIYGGGK